jgi:putative transposase
MVFKLADAAHKSWRRLEGHNQLPKLIQAVSFANGTKVAAARTLSPSPTAGDSSHSALRVL